MSGARRVAFVLSGGASLGAVEAGMLRALYEPEIVPDVVVATSAGALNAAFIASRPQTVQTADALAEIWRGLRRGRSFRSISSPDFWDLSARKTTSFPTGPCAG